MKTLTANDALSIVRRYAREAAGGSRPSITELWRAANDLWTAEYETYRALAALGHYRAAQCAWQRRTSYCNLALILAAAL
jgi:hypothetical protein